MIQTLGGPPLDAECVRRLPIDQKIATMPELKAALRTDVDLTVFRKLRELTLPLQLLPPREVLHSGGDRALRCDGAVVLPFRVVFKPRHARGRTSPE